MEATFGCSAVSAANHVCPHGMRRSLMEHSQLSSNFSYWTSTFPSRLAQPNVVDHASASRCLRERPTEAATSVAFAAYLLR